MAVGVVDALEVIGVHHQQRQRAARLLAARQLQFRRLEEGAPVGQPGQVVAIGGPAQVFADVALVGNIANNHAVGGLLGAGLAYAPRQRRDQRAAPELAAVGAPPPALVQRPAVAVGVAQALQLLLRGAGAGRIEQRIRPSLDRPRRVSSDPADAVVPAVDTAAAIKPDQGIVGDVGHDGVQPGVGLAQLALAQVLLGDIAEHRHQARIVQLEHAQRQHLRTAAGRVGAQVQPRGVADLAVRRRKVPAQQTQVRRHRRQRVEQIGQAAVARQRHQQLRRQGVEHQDRAIGRQLHQPHRRHVEKLQQRLVFLRVRHPGQAAHKRCTST
ncbi:hypothetical protein DUGA2_64850 [Duganella sp. HH101]|nr:hypothetical protein DUGA2_64820 [Duganella sp. HH101]OEZ94850.1 hypothetical protein DUGA2_64850 [Duganella sp. HH101]